MACITPRYGTRVFPFRSNHVLQPGIRVPALLALLLLGLVVTPTASAQHVGPEFRVNETTMGYQRTSIFGNGERRAVASDASGNFVVVWSSNQEGAGEGDTNVWARRFDAAGSPLSGEFRVNSYTTESQTSPAVAMNSSGNFVVAWMSRLQDGSGYGIYAQRYNASGTAVGSELHVSTRTGNDQSWPAVTMSSGGFVVAWMGYNQDSKPENYGIYAQRYNAGGARSGVEFQVNTRTEGNQQWPSLAGDANGNFVVTWMSYAQDGSGWGTYAQRYTAAGARVGGEFRVNTSTYSDQSDPSVAVNPNGNFVVTWVSGDGDGEGIWAQRYSAAGVAAGAEFRVNTTTTYNQRFPSVAIDASGNFVVTWQSSSQDGSSWGIYAQRYTAAGAAAGGEFRVNTTASEAQEHAALAMQGTDNFVVVWQGMQTGKADVYGQRFSTANRPPVTTAQSVTTSEDTTVTFTLAGTDPDSDTLTFAVASHPPNGSLSCSSAGACSYTPRANYNGSDSFTFTVNDGKATSAAAMVSITVGAVNDAPVLASIGSRTVAENAALTFTISATDVDNDAITFSASSLPSGASFAPATRTFSWTPGYTAAGTYAGVTFTVTDSKGSTDSESITITVTNTNRAPVLGAIGDKTVAEGSALAFTASATDADGETVTYSASGLPAGASFSTSTGAFTWTPGYSDEGTVNLTITATDPDGANDSEAIVITVTNTNRAPVLSAIADRQVNEQTAADFTATATDPEGDALTFTATGLPAGATLLATGELSWTPSEADGPGAYPVIFRVTDSGGLFDEESVTITVAEVNVAPLLADSALQGDEGTALSTALSATDSDSPSNAVSYAMVGGSATGMSLDSAGNFSWTPTEAQGAGVYEVLVQVTDDGTPALSATATITVTVNEVNVAPELGSIGDQPVDEETALTFTASATDVDLPANDLTFTLEGAPAGASMDGATGAFTWTPSEAQGPDTYTFTIRVSDGEGLSDSETITVTVSEVNVGPVLEDSPQEVDEETTLSFTISGSDSDLPANGLSYEPVSGMEEGMSLGADGNFSWTPSEAQGPGVFKVVVRVTDDGSPALSDEATITITVNEVNIAPEIDPVGDHNVDEETALTFTASASDVDIPANTLTFSLVGAPSGATINGATGAFSWTPTEEQGPGSYTFTVRVTDEEGLYADTETTVTVNEVNVAPVLDPIQGRTTQWGDEVTFTATASDQDVPANTLTFSLSGAPEGASIEPSTGAFSWTPAGEGIGSHTFDVVVTDDGEPSLGDLQSVTITVTKRATTLVYDGDLSGQYSDTTGVSATLTDAGTGAPIEARTIDFEIGTQGTSDDTSAAGVAESGITINGAPGAYHVDSEFDGDALYFASFDSDGFEVNEEDAAVTYTGTVFTSTWCETCSNGVVVLAATVQDITAATGDPQHDAEAGEILKATLTFVNRDRSPDDSGYVICTAPLGLVSAGDTMTAVGTCNWNIDIGSSDSTSFTIGMIVGGWYTQNDSSDNTVVTVSKPQRDSISGGGYIINEASSGMKPGEAGQKTNFGFNVKYNKGGKKLQGNMNIIVRNGGRVYQLKGNVMSSLSVNRATNQAVFNGKANIQDITDPLNPLPVDGNATLQVEMTDNGDPGDADSIGITLFNKDGGVWFTSRWNGVKTVEQTLDGGNLQIR